MNRRSFFGGLAGAFGLVLGLFGLRRPKYSVGFDPAVSNDRTAHVSFIEWIPVEERLPDSEDCGAPSLHADQPKVARGPRPFLTQVDRDEYLVASAPSGLVRSSAFSRWFEGLWGTPWTANDEHFNVTHWAELPKGPA